MDVGEEIVFEHRGMVVKPFVVIPNLVSGELTREAWERTCAVSGILDLELSEAAQRTSP